MSHSQLQLSDRDASINRVRSVLARIPVSSVPLSKYAIKALRDYEQRCIAHVLRLADLWIEAQEVKKNNYLAQNNSVFRDVGFLLSGPNNIAKEIFKMVKGRGADNAMMGHDKAVKKVKYLKRRSALYVFEVRRIWIELSARREVEDKDSMLLYKDLGYMLQLRDTHAAEIIRLTLDKIDSGDINEETSSSHTTSDTLDVGSSQSNNFAPPARPRDKFPPGLKSLAISEAPVATQVQLEPADERIRPGDWQCKICEEWNKSHHNDCRGSSWCNGRKAEDTKEVHCYLGGCLGRPDYNFAVGGRSR